MTLTRRQALTLMATFCGGTLFGAHRMLAGIVNPAGASPAFSAADLTLLNDIGETILPATAGSGGAKAADVAAFMQEIVRDFYDDAERATFADGLVQLQAASRARFSGRDFLALTPDERHAFLLTFEKPNVAPDYYRMLKQLTLTGYFSSEVGQTEAFAYLPVPGRYDGDVTIPPHTKAWAE